MKIVSVFHYFGTKKTGERSKKRGERVIRMSVGPVRTGEAGKEGCSSQRSESGLGINFLDEVTRSLPCWWGKKKKRTPDKLCGLIVQKWLPIIRYSILPSSQNLLGVFPLFVIIFDS